MIHPTEDDLEGYKRQDREDAGLARLEKRRRREPPIGDPCEECDGEGLVSEGPPEMPGGLVFGYECPRCQGTGVR